MPAYKDNKTGKWFCKFYYTDWQGNNRQKWKRGFATKKEALAYERDFLEKQSANPDMTFQNLYELYMEDMTARLKKSTILTKKHICETHILPFFGKKPINEIKASDVRRWQNQLMNSPKGYSKTYLKTINNQLTCMINYAKRFYDLNTNPCGQAGSIGQAKAEEMDYWTYDEYIAFREGIKDKPLSYICFQVLYWTGMREGDDDDKIRLNQRKPSKYKGLRRFGPEKNLQRINKFMKERPIFYKNLIQMKENIRFYLRCFYCITKVMILQFNSENRTELARNG